MTRPVDQANVLRLYEELGVRPEDGVERLTERYRERIRELHPDRGAARQHSASTPDRGDGIGWLTRSYREAVAFDRVHGRLPGAAGRRAAGTVTADTARTSPGQRPRIQVRPTAPRILRTQPGYFWRWLVALITIIAVVLATMPELLDMRPVTPGAVDRSR